jgi:hypothetical protein
MCACLVDPGVSREGSTFVKTRLWMGSLVLLLPVAAACGSPAQHSGAQHSAARLSCATAAHSLKPARMPTPGKFTAELSFNGGGNGFTLQPPPAGARPLVSASQAWDAVFPQALGNQALGKYRFILADMSNYNPYPGTVLNWVLMDTRVPSIIHPPVPGARSLCMYLDQVTIVNATSGAVDAGETFSPSLAEVPRVLTCRNQSPASGGPSCRWRIAKWPWGSR